MLRRFATALLSLSLLSTAALAAPGAPGAPRPDAYPPIADRVTAPSRAAIKKALAARRAKNLAAFRAYRKAGVYPHNTIRSGPLNVWRDGDGHLCAAATILAADGQQAVVEQIATSDNFIRLLDVTDGPLLDWMLTSGFTIEEIDRIQRPFRRPDPGARVDEQRRIDRQLAAEYARIDAELVAHRRASLELAVDRLLEYPLLARQLVAAHG